MNTQINPGIVIAIRRFGGVTPFAMALGVSGAAVGQWRDGVRQVPAERCVQIEQITGGEIRCEHLRPDVNWGVLRENAMTKVAA